MPHGISQAEFKVVFAKATPELNAMGKWILEVCDSLPDTHFSATDKAITFSTEVAFGFMRCTSRSIDMNLFVPKDQELDSGWKESRHTVTKKLATCRLWTKSELTSELEELISIAHRLSSRPRNLDLNTKEGFLSAMRAMKADKKR